MLESNRSGATSSSFAAGITSSLSRNSINSREVYPYPGNGINRKTGNDGIYAKGGNAGAYALAVKTFGEFVRWSRARKGLNKAQFAELLGVDAKTVTNIERRETSEGTGDVAIAKIAKLFGVSEESLLNWQPGVVTIELTTDIYTSIVERAEAEGHESVPSFLASVATSKTTRIKKRPGVGSGAKAGTHA